MGKWIDWWLKCARVACFSAGPALLLVGVGFAVHTTMFLRSAVRTQGTVIANQEQTDEEGNVTYRPVFRFLSQDGRQVAVTSDTGVSPAFAVGSSVNVFYEPENPTGAKVDSFAQLWLFPFVFGLLGITTPVAGWILLLVERRRERQKVIHTT